MFAYFLSFFLSTFTEVLIHDTTHSYKYAPICYDRTLDADFANSSEYLYAVWYRFWNDNSESLEDKYELLHAFYWGLFREITSPITNTIVPRKYCDEL